MDQSVDLITNQQIKFIELLIMQHDVFYVLFSRYYRSKQTMGSIVESGKIAGFVISDVTA